jgi:hypothetical protein
VQDWIAEVASRFRHVRFVVDVHQLLYIVQQYESRFEIERFDFQGGAGNHRLAVNLRQLITQKQIAWYPGCGAIAPVRSGAAGSSPINRDDLESELASLLLRQSGSGRVRFDHRHDGLHHDDRAFTLALAALQLCEQPTGEDFLEITPPAFDGGFLY